MLFATSMPTSVFTIKFEFLKYVLFNVNGNTNLDTRPKKSWLKKPEPFIPSTVGDFGNNESTVENIADGPLKRAFKAMACSVSKFFSRPISPCSSNIFLIGVSMSYLNNFLTIALIIGLSKLRLATMLLYVAISAYNKGNAIQNPASLSEKHLPGTMPA
jgi:hypothetical protein